MTPQPSIPSDPLPPSIPPNRKKPVLLALAALVLVIMLAAAAFLAGRLMNRKPSSRPQSQILGGPAGSGGVAFSADASGSSGPSFSSGEGESIQLDFQPAEELPTTQPATSGLFTRREDNSIFLGTGNMSVSVMAGPNGGDAAELSASYDGPVVEVVITKETLLYRDATQPDMENPSAAVKQEVEPGTLEDLNSQSMVTVWGQKTGDRIVAEVILYSLPMMIQAPAP